MLFPLCYFSLQAAYRFDPSTITINNITLAAVNTSYLSPTKDIEYMSSRKLQVETLLGVSLMLLHT